MFGNYSTRDPFAFLRVGANAEMVAPDGKTIADPRLIAGEDTLVIVGCGKSLLANSVNATYSPTHSTKIDNLSIYKGGTYRAADPLLGPTLASSGGNCLLRLADKMIAGGGAERIILVPIGIGSTTAARWSTTGYLFPCLLAAARRCAALGLPEPVFWWDQGQSDHATPQAAYEASVGAMITGVRAEGFVRPWFINKSTYTGGVTDADIQAAQAPIPNGVDILVGADADSLTSANRYDNVH